MNRSLQVTGWSFLALLLHFGQVHGDDAATFLHLGHGGITVQTLAFTSNGKRLLSSADQTAIIWDVASRRQISKVSEIGPHSMSDDGKTLLAQGGSLWDGATGRSKGAISPGGGLFMWAKLSPNGKLIVAFHKTRRLKPIGTEGEPPTELVVFDAITKRKRFTLIPKDVPQGAVATRWLHSFVSFSPDSKLIAAHHSSGVVFLFNSTTGQQVATLEGFNHLSGGTQRWEPHVWLADSKSLVNLGLAFRQWDVASRQVTLALTERYSPPPPRQPGRFPRPGEDSRMQPTAEELKNYYVLPAGLSNFGGVGLSPDGKRYAYYVDKPKFDNTVRKGDLVIFDIPNRSAVTTIPIVGDDVVGLAFSHDGRWLALGFHRGAVKLLDLSKLNKPVSDGQGVVESIQQTSQSNTASELTLIVQNLKGSIHKPLPPATKETIQGVAAQVDEFFLPPIGADSRRMGGFLVAGKPGQPMIEPLRKLKSEAQSLAQGNVDRRKVASFIGSLDEAKEALEVVRRNNPNPAPLVQTRCNQLSEFLVSTDRQFGMLRELPPQ